MGAEPHTVSTITISQCASCAEPGTSPGHKVLAQSLQLKDICGGIQEAQRAHRMAEWGLLLTERFRRGGKGGSLALTVLLRGGPDPAATNGCAEVLG
jgi:hypothetical protein